MMGHYAIYIWPAYGIVSAALVVMVASIYWKKKRVVKQLQRWYKRS